MAKTRPRRRKRRIREKKFTFSCHSGKRRYTFHSDAYMEMLRINSVGLDAKEIRNIYYCKKCDGYHLTSMVYD